jgi:DedD protein
MSTKSKPVKKNKKSTSGLSRKQLIVWISLTFVASAWMFVLGIIVGRGTAPVKFDIEKLQNELALLRETGIMKELRKYKIDSGVDNHTTEMGFYETLKDNKKEAGLKTEKRELPDKSLPESIESETKKTVKPKKSTLEKTPKVANTGSVNSKVSKSKPFTIQVAALRDPKAADRMVAELKKKGFPAYRRAAEISGKGTWYRVRVGAYTSREEAGSTLGKLSKSQVKGMVVLR